MICISSFNALGIAYVMNNSEVQDRDSTVISQKREFWGKFPGGVWAEM